MGRAQTGFAGAVPFDWREIQAFSEMAGAALNTSEAQCLMDMSRAYCTELLERGPNRIAPMERDNG